MHFTQFSCGDTGAMTWLGLRSAPFLEKLCLELGQDQESWTLRFELQCNIIRQVSTAAFNKYQF